MNLYKQIKYLTEKEIRLEWRQKFTFTGLLLYIISTIFISYLSFRKIIDVSTWNALFWIIMTFAAVNTTSKSFIQETRSRQLFIYTLASPQSVIFSKVLYNGLLMIILALLQYFFYTVLIGNPVQDQVLFLVSLVMGSIGFSSVLTMISAIAGKAGNNTTLMAILGLPIIIPLLITIIRLSKNAIDGLNWSVSGKYILMLGSINLIVLALSYLLFPYLWRD